MGKAWIDFKTDEDTFKIIIEYEEKFVKDIIEKKYGKNYDSSMSNNVISKADGDELSLAKLLVELDVLCANKLKEQHKDLIKFFSVPNNLMIRKICLAYNLTENEVEKVTLTSSSEAYSMFMCYFGINRKKIDLANITKIFDVTPREFYKNALQIMRQFNFNIKIEKENKQEKRKIPNMLIIDLEKKGYERTEIIEALNIYDNETKYTLQKYYGFNYSSAKSPLIPVKPEDVEIINNVLVGENNIDAQILKLREQKTAMFKQQKKKALLNKSVKVFNLKSFYKNKGYTALEFVNAYRSLNQNERSLIKKQFGADFNEIENAKLTDEEKKLIFDLTRSDTQGIGKILIETTKKSVPKIIKTTEKTQEVKKEISEKKNEKVIQPIKVKETEVEAKDILIPAKSNEFDFVEKKDINSSKVKYLAENKPNKKKGIKSFDTFNEYCKSLGFDEEDLENVYNELSEKEKERFTRCIIVTENEEKKHIFTFTKKITQNGDQINYQYYTQNVIIRLYRNRLRNNKPVDNIEASKNVMRNLKTNSVRGNNTPKIENYMHLNEYYKALGFDDEDLETLYLSLNENPIRHDCFYRLFNIIEEEKHMFVFKNPAADLNQKDHDYLTKDIPISLCKKRVKRGRGIDNIKLPPSIKKSGEKVRATPTISIKNYKTLNDFIKAIGFDDEDLENVYNELSKKEKDIFSETIKVTEAEDKKHIFTFTKRITRNDEGSYKYYNKAILVKLYRCRVKHNKEVDKLKLTESIKRYIKFHSPKTNRMEIIKGHKNLNEYYKSLGFDDEDLENLYLSLASMPFRHDFFYRMMNIDEEAKNKHIFTFKEGINSLNRTEIHYLMQDIPKSMVYNRLKSGKGVDNLNLNNTLTNFLKKEIEKENSKNDKAHKRKFDSCKTLNEYYKAYEITDEELTQAYKSAKQGKSYFNEFTTIIKTDEENYTFEIKSTLRYATPAYKYFTQNLLAYLKRKTKQNKKEETQDVLPVDKEFTFEDAKEHIQEYISDLKNSHIITKDLITNVCLPRRYEYFLLNEFVTNQKNELSLEEEAEILNIDVVELGKILIAAIELLKQEINKKMMIRNEDITKYLEAEESEPSDDGDIDIKKALK